MNPQKKLLIGIIVFIILLSGAYVSYQALAKYYAQEENQNAANLETAGENTQQGTGSSAAAYKKASDFTVYDASGNQVKLSDFYGKPIVLNFWASWCPPCQSEMPHFNEVYADYKNDIIFMMVDLTDGQRETKAKAQTYISQQGYSFPVYYDTNQNAADVYNVISIPATYLIDREGNIIKNYSGSIDKNTLLNGLQLLQ